MKPIQTNRVFREHFSDLLDSGVVLPPLPFDLLSCFDGGVVLVDGCFVLHACHTGSTPRDQFPDDETGYECFINHVHIEGTSERNSISIALAFLRTAEEHLRTIRPPGQVFHGIISSGLGDCTARFHALRAGQSWLPDDLDVDDEADAACLVEI